MRIHIFHELKYRGPVKFKQQSAFHFLAHANSPEGARALVALCAGVRTTAGLHSTQLPNVWLPNVPVLNLCGRPNNTLKGRLMIYKLFVPNLLSYMSANNIISIYQG